MSTVVNDGRHEALKKIREIHSKGPTLPDSLLKQAATARSDTRPAEVRRLARRIVEGLEKINVKPVALLTALADSQRSGVGEDGVDSRN
jgi:hypothetical protein